MSKAFLSLQLCFSMQATCATELILCIGPLLAALYDDYKYALPSEGFDMVRDFGTILSQIRAASTEFMARGGITKSNMLLLGGVKRAEGGVNRSLGTAAAQPAAETETSAVAKSGKKMEDSACWVPHPRTGIYFPRGQEWVMEDVPEGAARFSQTYWFRNVDGVDNPNASAPNQFHDL